MYVLPFWFGFVLVQTRFETESRFLYPPVCLPARVRCLPVCLYFCCRCESHIATNKMNYCILLDLLCVCTLCI